MSSAAGEFLGRSRQMRHGTGRTLPCKHCEVEMNWDGQAWVPLVLQPCSARRHEPDLPPEMGSPEQVRAWLDD